MEELDSYSKEYKKRLDETGALGNIPDDLALEVIIDRLTIHPYCTKIITYWYVHIIMDAYIDT